jgi:DNA-binding CsgD family transcriptional regulator
MRVLAAAETYQSMIEAGNGRPALSPQHAAAKLEQEVRSGRQDGNAVAAVLAEAGHRAPPVTTPAGMTSRELEVLRLVCAGRTSRQVATELGISVKTVNNHIERAYLKIGVGSRAAATLYLAQRGLV